MKALIYTVFTSLLFALLLGCSSDPKVSKEVSALDEDALKTNLPREFGDMLRAMKKDPTNHKLNGLYINEVGEYYLSVDAADKAIKIFKNGIIEHNPSPSTPSNIIGLAKALKSAPNKKQDYINLVQSLRVGNPSLIGLDEFSPDVPEGEPSMESKIAELQKNLTDPTTGRLDLKKVNSFVNTVEYFVIGNPTNEACSSYLKLAAEVVNSVKVFPRAIKFYDWILTQFPNSKEAPQALFMKGFTLDDGIGDKQAAKPVYEEFLKRYPKNDFADDTKFLLDNINKTDEEIIKQFDNKKK